MSVVLVVDDDAAIRDLLAAILAVEGYEVRTAATAGEALLLADASVALVTIDLTLPDLDGWELSRRLHEEPSTRHIRQMIVSGDPSLQTSLTPVGRVDAVLTKPFDFTRFTEVLSSLLAAPEPPPEDQQRADLLDHILTKRLLEPAYQPIVDLADGSVIGIEALARGPAGPLSMPSALFEAAAALGRLHELDSLCRLTALIGARDAAAAPPLVFVNVEPGTVDLPMSEELRALLVAPLPFQVVTEFTERALTRRVPALLRHAEEIRARGNLVALDDIGADPRSMALLPFVNPEIVKLDLSLLRPETPDGAATAVAAAAFAERTGAKVIAEGIETDEHLATAIAIGAQWGQGYLFGRPTTIEGALACGPVPVDYRPVPVREHIDVAAVRTPFEEARAAGITVQTTDVAGIRLLGAALRVQAREFAAGGSLIIGIRSAEYFEADTYDLCTQLAETAAMVAVLGVGIPADASPGVYGVGLSSDDPLAAEWCLVVVGQRDTTAFAARVRRGADGGPDEYDFVLSHDRALGENLARHLMRRVTPRVALERTTAVAAV